MEWLPSLPSQPTPAGSYQPSHKPPCWQVLKFKEGPLAHVVKNVLVDQGRIERTVLCDSTDELKRTLRNERFM